METIRLTGYVAKDEATFPVDEELSGLFINKPRKVIVDFGIDLGKCYFLEQFDTKDPSYGLRIESDLAAGNLQKVKITIEAI